MELRILYAAISWLTAWFASFFHKLSAEKWYSSYLFTCYTFFVAAFFSFFIFLFSTDELNNLLAVIVIGIIMWISYTLTVISRIESLKNISTTLYFPSYKIWSTLLAFFIWILFFTDIIKTNEIIWVIFGLFVPLVLINKTEHLNHKNLKKWIIMILISIFFAVITVSMSKTINFFELNIYFYTFIWNLTGGIISLMQYKVKDKKKNYSKKYIKRISLVNWILLATWSIFFVKSLVWNLWVAYTINSFSILIPIILSIIIYKDHLDLRKSIAIILTIISMLFFKVF